MSMFDRVSEIIKLNIYRSRTYFTFYLFYRDKFCAAKLRVCDIDR